MVNYIYLKIKDGSDKKSILQSDICLVVDEDSVALPITHSVSVGT